MYYNLPQQLQLLYIMITTTRSLINKVVDSNVQLKWRKNWFIIIQSKSIHKTKLNSQEKNIISQGEQGEASFGINISSVWLCFLLSLS